MATRKAMTAGDAVYARYSSELQNPRSCDDQITELREVLERRGGSFDERLVFSDSEVSGGVWDAMDCKRFCARLRPVGCGASSLKT